MKNFSATGQPHSSPLAQLGLAVLFVCLAAVMAASLGCGSDASSASDSGMEDNSVASNGGQSSASSSDDDSDDDQVVSRENPGFTGVSFDDTRSPALIDAQSIDAVRWTVEPAISDGALVAEGVLEQDAMLFSPTLGEGSAFSVYYKDLREPLVEVLPDLGPLQIWDTDLTVAPAEFELEGTSFRIRAYSPLFMDVGSPSELELRVFGFDKSGADSLLSVREINAK